jgi:hypothetical protein
MDTCLCGAVLRATTRSGSLLHRVVCFLLALYYAGKGAQA